MSISPSDSGAEAVPIQQLDALLGTTGAHYQDIYGHALDMYGLASLKSTQVYLGEDENTQTFEDGQLPDGTPYVMLGLGDPDSDLRYQIARQLKLPTGAIEWGGQYLKPAVFAHLLGHVVQSDENSEALFGPIDETIVPYNGINADQFDNSDRELHATYVATSLLGSSSLTALGLVKPNFLPSFWHVWAAERKAMHRSFRSL